MGIIIVLPIAAAIAVLSNKKIEEFLFLAIGTIISIIFLAGYFGNTLPGVYAGIILGIISLIYCAFVGIKDRERFTKCVLTQGFLGMIICICVSAAISLGRKSVGGLSDVCRVYAPQVINMYRYNNLGAGVGSVNYSILYSAPIVQSWCYFCNKLWIHYADDLNLWAHNIFVISGLFPFFVFVKKKEWMKTIILSIIVMILPNIVADTMTFMNDVPLGTAAAYGTIMTILYFRETERRNGIAYLAATIWGMMALCMIKRGGAIFSFGIVGVATIYVLKSRIGNSLNKGDWEKIMISVIIAVAFPLIFALYRIANTNTVSFTDFAFIYSTVIYIVMGIICYVVILLLKNKEYKKVACIIISLIILTIALSYVFVITRKNVEEAWLNTYAFFDEWLRVANPQADERRFQYRLSDLFFIILMSVIILVIRNHERSKGVSAKYLDELDVVSGPIVLGNIAVVLFTFLDFVRREWMRKHENTMYSISRYLGPGILILTVIVFYEIFSIYEKYNKYCMIGVLIMLMILIPRSYLRLFLEKGAPEWEKYENTFSEADVTFDEEDKVLCIGTNYYGLYAAFPADAKWDPIGFTSNETPEEWAKEIVEEGYDYLLIQDYLREFSIKYRDMFEDDEPSDYSIYKIEIENEKVEFVRE